MSKPALAGGAVDEHNQPRIEECMERGALLKRIRSELEAVYGQRLRLVMLYGSEARGEARPDSDIDVLVLLDEVTQYGAELRRCVDALYPLSLELERPISPIPVALHEYETVDCPLYRHVHAEGIAA
jgi:predicted nucleotidyltransferase